MNKQNICNVIDGFKKKRLYSYLILLIVIPCFLFVFGLTGCSKVEVGSDPGTGGGGTGVGVPANISLSITDPNIGIGEFVEVTATVTDSLGDPVGSGFQIDFSIAPSTIGSFTPNTYTNTSGSGIGVLWLYTLSPGSGLISGSYAGGLPGTLLIDVVGDPNAAIDPNSVPVPPPTSTGIMGGITITTGAQSIYADGTSYVAVRANIVDTAGVAMPDNTSVNFTTTAGDIDPILGGVQGTYNVLSAGGEAYTTLTSSTKAGPATIVASCDGYNISTTVDFIPGEPDDVIVIADPDMLVPDGTSTSTINITVLDDCNNPIADGSTMLTLEADYGVLSTLLTSTSDGEATVTYTAPDTAPPGGTDVITVKTTNEIIGNAVITLSAAAVDPNTPLTPVGSISISTGSSQVVADGLSYVVISADVKDTSGVSVLDNTMVTFTTTGGDIDPNIFGIQSSTTAPTVSGIARAKLYSSTVAGTVTVTASCQGFNVSTTVEFIPGPSSLVTVVAIPDAIVPDGASQSAITATVLDFYGNPVADGTQLLIDTNYGVLSTLITTTSNGVSSVTYTSPDTVPPGGTDRVNVTTPNNRTGSVDIILSAAAADPNAPGAQVGSITITAGSSQIVADANTAVTIRSTVKDTMGVDMPDGTIVTFTTTAGDFDPNTAGSQNRKTAPTTDGVATVRLTSSTKTGNVTITAESGGYNASTTVKFIPGPPASVSVESDPADLIADGTSTSVITVMVLDAFSNPVADGTLITFNAVDGELSSIIETTSVGRASVTYTAPGYVPAGGNDTVTAETTNEQIGTAFINLTGAQIANITLTIEPESLPADGTSKANITASLTILGGGPAPDDTPVLFTITSGGGTFQVGGGTTTTSYTAGGDAIARLISDPNVGTATIEASSGGIVEEIQITYTPGSVTVSVTPNSLLGTGNETANVVATLTDASGSPAPDGEMVAFTLSDGTLGTLVDPNGNTITDPNGRAFAFSSGGDGKVRVVFDASDKSGTITITATWSPGGISISGSVSATILESPADIRIADGYPDPMSISIKGTGGTATSRLTFDVIDAQGDPVPDGYRIDFAIQSGPNGGETVAPLSALTINGQVTTLLRSGTKAGPVSVKAYYYDNSEVTTTTSSVAISAGPPVGEEFGISAAYRNIAAGPDEFGFWTDGLRDSLTIRVGDISGNPVPDDTAISFKTYNTGGTMVPGSTQTVDGEASSTLQSSAPRPQQGFISVTAEATNGGRTTHVTSIAVTPTNDEEIMYVGTDGGGAYKSTDGGYTWETVSRSSTVPGQNWIDPYVNDIAVDPDNHNTLYAATGYLGKGNVYRSLDAGLNWNSSDSEEWNGLLSLSKAVLSVACDDGGSSYVWIGTNGLGALFASDGEDFKYGGTVAPAGATGLDPNSNYTFDVNKGYMTVPTLSGTSKTEAWTVTYDKTDAYLNHNIIENPDDRLYLFDSPSGSGADGYMDHMEVDPPVDSETWTVTYTGGFDPNGPHTLTVPGRGTLYVMSTSKTTKNETWTVTYRDPNIWPSGGFYVFGTKTGGGMYDDLMTPYTSPDDEVSFAINQTGLFQEGDQFTFTTRKDAWDVAGTYSDPNGTIFNDAQSDIPYSYGGLQFTVNSGSQFFKYGDYFKFYTTASGNWIVSGSKSGIQSSRAYTGTEYSSDNDEVTFTIYSNVDDYEEGDQYRFNVTSSGAGIGKTIRDIVQVPDGNHGANATLYAATDVGVLETANGGIIWTATTSFTGNSINTIAAHPTFNNVVYAGTESNGVWVSTDGGTTWTKESDGLGKGLGATDPLPNPGNKGNGSMTDVTVDPNVLSETWTVTCKTAVTDGGVFSVSGSRSGSLPDATVGVLYAPAGESISFTIYDGTFDFEVGDTFTFETVRDPGSKIKDIMVDSQNNKIYAITYFLGPLEAHAVGNLYVHDLNPANGALDAASDWQEANQGLPYYDPPDDMTLFAQHCLAMDDPANPQVLYVGGEGINFYRAESGIAAGSPAWQQSKTGLSNLIMARMPILFSGYCFLDVRQNIISSSLVNFTIYLQDENGNPPVAGSQFLMELITPDTTYTIYDITYPDTYTYRGTYSNPADSSTNNPYSATLGVATDYEVHITFTPASSSYPSPPGSSGVYEKYVFTY